MQICLLRLSSPRHGLLRMAVTIAVAFSERNFVAIKKLINFYCSFTLKMMSYQKEHVCLWLYLCLPCDKMNVSVVVRWTGTGNWSGLQLRTGVTLGFEWLWNCLMPIVQEGSHSSGKILLSTYINSNFNAVEFLSPNKKQIYLWWMSPFSFQYVPIMFIPLASVLPELLPLHWSTPEATIPKVSSCLVGLLLL